MAAIAELTRTSGKAKEALDFEAVVREHQSMVFSLAYHFLRDHALAEELLARLAETPRMIVIFRYQEGLEPMEIAELLEMPLATVKSHLQRALALLRRKVAAATREGQHGL